MKIVPRSLVLFSLCLNISVSVLAKSSDQPQLQQACAKVKSAAQSGKMLYEQKKYTQALRKFEYQAAWTQFCHFSAEESGTHFTEQHVALANNNVGLTYARLGQPLWARAWFLLNPDSKTSQYNLKQLKFPKNDARLEGQYVRAAGFGQWNYIQVTRTAKAYQIWFEGYYFGLLGLINGPNVGEFKTSMSLKHRQAEYQYEDCKISLNFLNRTPYGPQVVVQQQDNMSDCGFGHNVSAEGTFYKVEDH